MSKEIRGLLADVAEGLKMMYGRRLQGVYLYGSYARGEQDAESDVDLLVVLDDVPHYGAEIDRTSELIASLSRKYGVSLSRVFVSEEDWGHGDTAFLENARDEAVPA